MSPILASALWISGPAADGLLIGTIVFKKRWQRFPGFTSFVAFDAIWVTSLFLINSSAVGSAYKLAYFSGSVVSFFLQIAILFEVARHVLKQPDKWSAGAIFRLSLFGAVGAVCALIATSFIKGGKLTSWPILLDDMQIFSGLITCELIIAISLAAGQLGLPLRSHVLAIGQGLAAWSLLAAAAFGLELLVGDHGRLYVYIDVFRALIYPLTVLYWTVSLWHEEPARKPISPALRKYIVALNDQVQYDLGKVGH